MSREVVTINLFRYRTPDGEPTCSISPKETCVYLSGSLFSPTKFCNSNFILTRGNNGIGYLVPHKDCPLFKDEKTDYL